MLRRALLLVPLALRSCRFWPALNATTASADSSSALAHEVSPGKGLNFLRIPSGCTCCVLMRVGLRVCWHACRPQPASLPVRVPMVADLLPASFSSTLAGVALRLHYSCSHQLRCHLFMSLVQSHAGHTSPWQRHAKNVPKHNTPCRGTQTCTAPLKWVAASWGALTGLQILLGIISPRRCRGLRVACPRWGETLWLSIRVGIT
jgi:hypothetical protein